jgi:hypothetical protein
MKMQRKGSRFSKKERTQQPAEGNNKPIFHGGKDRAQRSHNLETGRRERRMQRTGGDRRRHRGAGKQSLETLTTTKIAQNGTEKESQRKLLKRGRDDRAYQDNVTCRVFFG